MSSMPFIFRSHLPFFSFISGNQMVWPVPAPPLSMTYVSLYPFWSHCHFLLYMHNSSQCPNVRKHGHPTGRASFHCTKGTSGPCTSFRHIQNHAQAICLAVEPKHLGDIALLLSFTSLFKNSIFFYFYFLLPLAIKLFC